MNTEIAIDVKGLVKKFGGKTAVNNVDIKMPKGKVWGFLGPNGSGKTTTIRMICGLLKPTAGSGSCLGFDVITESNEIKSRTGYMTQKFSFWQDLSIRENLDFVARMYNLSPKKKIVDETLEKLSLSHRQDQLCAALSGGWKQRLALAAVTMQRPQLLLLDEPTAGVDPQARREFWDEIHTLASEGMTILVSTHYMDEAERCDEIVYLAHGNLIINGRIKDVIASSNLFTYRGRGKTVREILPIIKRLPGVEHAGYFGSALHISGRNRQKLEQAIDQLAEHGIDWTAIQPSLEDVFIALMEGAGIDQRDF